MYVITEGSQLTDCEYYSDRQPWHAHNFIYKRLQPSFQRASSTNKSCVNQNSTVYNLLSLLKSSCFGILYNSIQFAKYATIL